MANAAPLNLPRGEFYPFCRLSADLTSKIALVQDQPLLLTFPFLSLPLEIRNMIYEYVIFSDRSPEFFIVNPKIRLSLLQVNRAVSHEASIVLYTSRIAVIAFLPHQYYLHGRERPVDQLFRVDNDGEHTTRVLARAEEPQRHSPGHIYPHVLAKFSRVRLCLFFPATFQTAYPLMFFDPIAELKSALEVLRDHSPSSKQNSPARNSLEIIVAVYPRPEDEKVETAREARVREDFVRRGITKDLKEVRKKRTLKVGGNFTREGLVRFCRVTCGDQKGYGS
jgi:hypothetical protein